MRITAVCLLLIALLIQWLPHWSAGSSFSTMPIFTPVSLQYEKLIRNGDKPLDIRQAMEIIHNLDVTNGTVQENDLIKLRDDRKKMLDLRNQRHALNIEMMELAIDIVDHLTPQQWEVITAQRDAIQAQVEMDIFDDLLKKLK